MKFPAPLKFLAVTTFALIFFAVGHVSAIVIYQRDGGFKTNGQKTELSGSSSYLSNNSFDLLREIYSKLKDNYLQEKLPSERELIEGSAKGLISALNDRYTNYYTAAEWAEIQSSNAGNFEGIGVKLIPGEEYVSIETALAGSPAANAGLAAQDLILEIDGQSAKGLSSTKVAEKIRGEKGTEVSLKIYRPETEKTIDFKIKRAQITMKSIEYRKLEKNGLQIIVSRFTDTDIAEFQRLWREAVNAAKVQDARFIILDLRNNTGGWVSAAKYLLEDFLPKDTVIFKEMDRNGNTEEFRTERDGELKDTPLAVLVNEGSASASEIVAGALQDIGRAKLIGKPTLGKGVEQTIQNTSDGGVMFIVFKRWLTPKGKNLSEQSALKPDKEVNLTIEDIRNLRDPQLAEAVGMLQ